MILVAKNITLTASFVAVGTGIGNFSFVAAADNAGVAYIRGDDGSASVPIPKGTPFRMESVDLATVFFKGSVSDTIVLIGYKQP